MLALIVENRLFVANCGKCNFDDFLLSANEFFTLYSQFTGTPRCFLYLNNITNPIVPVNFDHTVSNEDEKLRLRQLNAPIAPAEYTLEEDFIKYTRCIGDFRSKLYYLDIDQFK